MHLFLIVLQIVIIEHKSIICPGYNAVLHIHTCIEEVEITVSVLLSCGVNIDNPLVEVRSSVLTYLCRAADEPWVSAVTVSISLLKRSVSRD